MGDSANLAPAYLILHLVHTQLGSPDRVAYRGLALALYEELGDPKGQASALNNMGIDAYYEGDWESAVDRYERSRKLYERIGDAPNVGITANNIGEILSDQGRLEEAEAMFEAVLHDAEVMGHRFLSSSPARISDAWRHGRDASPRRRNSSSRRWRSLARSVH